MRARKIHSPTAIMIFASALVIASISKPVYAECGPNIDWPEAPCFDVGSPSIEEQRQAWAKYYEFKGREWMEMKKAEMDMAIADGTLRDWVLYQGEPDNSANRNVYHYYYLNDQAPALNDRAAGNDPTIVNTNWQVSIEGWATVVGLGSAGLVAIFFVFRKARQK